MKQRHLIFMLLLTLFSLQVNAQCAGATPHSGGTPTTVDATGAGTLAWTNPSLGASASDGDATAAYSALLLGSKTTHLLKATGFGFNLLATDKICGITVTVTKKATGSGLLNALGLGALVTAIFDDRVSLYKGGALQSTDYSGQNWSYGYVTSTYGGPNNLWGSTWLYSDINSASFGVGISATIDIIAVGGITASIDAISITVSSYSVLPVSLISFYGKQNQNCTTLTWTTESEPDNDHFTVEKMIDGVYTPIGDIDSKMGIDEKLTDYRFEDCDINQRINYYRLTQTDNSGHRRVIGDEVAIAMNMEVEGDILIAPNPANAITCVYSKNAIANVTVMAADGKLVHTETIADAGTKQVCLPVDQFLKGMYTVTVETTNGSVTRKLIVD